MKENIKNIIRPYAISIMDLLKDKEEIRKNNIIYINWWKPSSLIDIYWFSNFIEYHFRNKITKNIEFYSVFGPRRFLRDKKNNTVKIFYSAENLDVRIKYKSVKEEFLYKSTIKSEAETWRKRYKDFAVSDVDLAMSYQNKTEDNYMKFPFWIPYILKPNFNYKDVKSRIEDINSSKFFNKSSEAVVITSHDVFGTRGKICEDLIDYLNIIYAGRWRNNTNDLWKKYNNDKIGYMKNFKFNICPENMVSKEYVTEKLFDAFLSGTIPIYNGALNSPEPEILSHNGIIFWDFNSDNRENIKLVQKLIKNDKLYYAFLNQNKFTSNAAELIWMKIEELKKRISELLY